MRVLPPLHRRGDHCRQRRVPVVEREPGHEHHHRVRRAPVLRRQDAAQAADDKAHRRGEDGEDEARVVSNRVVIYDAAARFLREAHRRIGRAAALQPAEANAARVHPPVPTAPRRRWPATPVALAHPGQDRSRSALSAQR